MDIFIDTSALPEDLSRVGQLFRRMALLASQGLVNIYVSEIVVREWKSRLSSNYHKRASGAERSIEYLIRQPFKGASSPLDMLEEALRRSKDSFANHVMSLADIAIDRFVTDCQLQIIPIGPQDTGEVWDQYFSGEGPFRSAKHRNDIPDAFI